MAYSRKPLAVCLTGVLVCLLLVGLASSTFVRHLVQVVPILLVLVALSQHQSLSPYLALPLFIIWALLMTLIWMYLLGIATFFSGSFSPVEIVLTVLIGGFAMAGIAACLRSSSSPVTQRTEDSAQAMEKIASALGLTIANVDTKCAAGE